RQCGARLWRPVKYRRRRSPVWSTAMAPSLVPLTQVDSVEHGNGAQVDSVEHSYGA
ncbi:hypothetical protein CBR_g62840, partial [Chara braunii]